MGACKRDVNKEIDGMQNKIYEYFSETHGQAKDKEINEYKNWKKIQLENNLKLLKSQTPKPVEEIKQNKLAVFYEKDTNNVLTTKLSSTKIIGNIAKKYLNRRVKKLTNLQRN